MEQTPSESFLDAAKVVGGRASDDAPFHEHSFSRIIEADQVLMAAGPVMPQWGPRKETGEITVDVVRDGNRITGIRIACPCGRHAELDVQYAEGGAGA